LWAGLRPMRERGVAARFGGPVVSYRAEGPDGRAPSRPRAAFAARLFGPHECELGPRAKKGPRAKFAGRAPSTVKKVLRVFSIFQKHFD